MVPIELSGTGPLRGIQSNCSHHNSSCNPYKTLHWHVSVYNHTNIIAHSEYSIICHGNGMSPPQPQLELGRASLVAQRVKHLPAMQETWVRSLGQEDALEKEMTTHSSTLAWKIPWTEKPGRLQSMGSQRVGHD